MIEDIMLALCIVLFLLNTIIGMAIFVKSKYAARTDECKVLKRYVRII